MTKIDEAMLLREVAYNLSSTDPQEVKAMLQVAANKIDELRRIIFDYELADYKGEVGVLRAQLAAYKQVGYMAHIDGKPCWDADDVVCVDAVWPAGPDDDRVSVPIFTREAEK